MLTHQVRIDSKYKKKYAKGTTAYRRVLAHPAIPQAVKDTLNDKHTHLNPLLLRRHIATLTEELFTRNRTLREPVVNTSLEPIPG